MYLCMVSDRALVGVERAQDARVVGRHHRPRRLQLVPAREGECVCESECVRELESESESESERTRILEQIIGTQPLSLFLCLSLFTPSLSVVLLRNTPALPAKSRLVSCTRVPRSSS